MFSLSTSKRRAAKAAAQAQQKAHQRAVDETLARARSDDNLAPTSAGGPSSQTAVDDFGRVLSSGVGGGWTGRSKSEASRSAASALPLSPPLSTSKLPPLPPTAPRWLFSPTLLPPPPGPPSASDDLPWGLIPVRTNVVLGIPDLKEVVHTLADQLGRRGCETPLLFSSLALDVSAPRIARLVETYLATLEPQPGTSQKQLNFTWAQELTFAGERELAWVLRWALARVVQVRPVLEATNGAKGGSQTDRQVDVEEKRGLVDIEKYMIWRDRERATSYPMIHWHAFTALLGPDLQPIFNDLFSMFSRLAAHSHVGGCTPTVLGSLFGPLLFGLPPSSSLQTTHQAFSRSALATEHLLLSYLRSQSHSLSLRASSLPGRLQSWIAGYPATLATDRALEEGRVRLGVKCVKAEGLRRDVRAYSKELFRTGEQWAGEMEHPEGPGRPDIMRTWVERVVIPSRAGSALAPSSGPKFTADYKKRLHVSTHLPPLLSKSLLGGGGASEFGAIQRVEDEDDKERWKSLSEKQWGDFMTLGFDVSSSPSSASLGSVDGKGKERRRTISKQLEFDLTESARKAHHEKRETLTWNDFSSAGFLRSEGTLSESLSFSNPIQRDILEWPEHREEVRRRLKKMQKDLPSFDYNTRPRHVGEVLIEEAFVDCWADILISGGWMDRSDTTLREVNWAIVNYKALPAPGTVTRQSSVSPHDDPRTEDIYIFYEEIVPVEYQSRLVSTKKSFGLFSPKRYKKSSNGPDTVGGRSKRDKEEDFESSVLRGRPTKMLSLTSRSHQPTSRAPYPTYDDSATRTPGHLSPSRALFSTPGRKDGVRPSRSAGELKAGDKRALSPVPMQKVTSKKEAKRIQGISPFDPNEMEFEMRMASSEVDGTLRRKAHGREPSRDDLWIDILVSNGGQKQPEPDLRSTTHPRSSVRILADLNGQSSRPPADRSDLVAPAPPFASQPSSKFFEKASSEVDSLGGTLNDSPSPAAPSVFSGANSPVVSNVRATPPTVVVGTHVSDQDLVGDGDDAIEILRSSPEVVEHHDPTKSGRLKAAVIGGDGEHEYHDSSASDFAQHDNDLYSSVDDQSPRMSDFEPTEDQVEPVTLPVPAPVFLSASSYVHGQPLHNLMEEEEEE